MDLRAMLNESSDKKDPPKQPPRLYTSQSSHSECPPSFDGRQSYPQSAYMGDGRVAGNGYFPPQSPAQQNSASTPSAGTHSASTYGHSPHGHYNISRENSASHASYPPNYIPSPSPAHPQPSTPGSSYTHQQAQQTTYSTPYTSQPPAQHRPQSRDGSMNANGVPPHYSHHMSPPPHYHQQPPSTPLGPPTAYPRPSPQTQRPSSQGYESYRRLSVSSVGSTHSRDYSAHAMTHPAVARGGSVQRTFSADEALHQDRERSIESVSPKTIPRPPPQRQSTGSYSQETASAPTVAYQSPTPSAPPQYTQPPQPQPSAVRYREPQQAEAGLVYQSPVPPGSADSRAQSTYSARPTPEARANSSMTPQSTHSSLPPQPSPVIKREPQPQQSLKRNASVISTTPAAVMPPRKRLRRDEIPIWARSARNSNCKPIKFVASPAHEERHRQDRHVKHEPVIKAEVPHQTAANGHPQPEQSDPSTKWEDSILNNIPHENLIRKVCDWIYLEIGQRQPPSGAAFEIEAKIGSIIDTHQNGRLRLPVKSEAIFDKETYWNPTKFESTMNMAQHKFMNEWLNQVTHDSFREAHSTNPNRECLRSQHTVEVDEFSELAPEGVSELDPSFRQYLRRDRAPKVRRTVNKRTNEVTARIIKSRIADLEVYNPDYVFDYRISINLEAPWNGSTQHLIPSQDSGAQDRSKDRVSYRHLAYQIDLTQISHPGSERKDHELEVEISVDATKREIGNLIAGRESKYEQLVHGFINNVRILCRKGSEVR